MDEPLLATLKTAASTLDVVAFGRKHEGMYLIGAYVSAVNAGDDPWAFQTVGAITQPSEAAIEEAAAALEEQRQRFLLNVAKSDRNPFGGLISLGRATNNDMVLRHPSVSKLHAHFVPEPTSDHLTVVDVGSSNGTHINGQRLRPDEPRSVRSGDRLQIGDLACELMHARLLYHELRRLFPRLRLSS